MTTRQITPRDQRRRTVLELVQARSVHSHGELQELLAQRGFDVNQATLSRDLRDLGIWKSHDGYALAPVGSAADPAAEQDGDVALVRALRLWLSSATPAQNLVILKTPPGGAQPLALAIDRAELRDAIGSVAGDDTIFVATSTASAARRLVNKLTTVKKRGTL